LNKRRSSATASAIPRLGDWDRTGGLVKLYYTSDLVTLDAHLTEARAGLVLAVPEHLRVGYVILSEARRQRGLPALGHYEDTDVVPPPHPLLYLWSVIRHVGSGGWFPPIVENALEEFERW